MSLQESRVVNGAKRSAVALRSADRGMGNAARSITEIFGGAVKLLIVGSAAVAGTVYMVKLLDGPAREVASDAAALVPDMRSQVDIQSPVVVESGNAPVVTNPNVAGWTCAEGIRDDATINDFLGRMVIAEYGLGDYPGDYNDPEVYDQAMVLLQTPEFAAINPHITNINNPPVGEDVFFPNCDTR